MHPLRIPELVIEIAAFVTTPRDLISLAQVDQLSHTAVAPCLFRSIDIPLESIHSLAQTIRKYPHYAAHCRSLTLSSDASFLRHDQVVPVPDDETLARLYADLIAVLTAVSAQGQLESFRWTSCLYRGRAIEVSDDVCKAVAAALGFASKEVALGPLCVREQICDTLTNSKLRALCLYLPRAHGWDCAHLQAMIDTLADLEDLSLELPVCCNLHGITLRSTHPLLTCFSFISTTLVPESDFLVRHPRIHALFLETEQSFTFDPNVRSMLRALNTDETSLCASPSLLNAQITHLRLREVDEYMEAMPADALRALAPTLRCLELEVIGARDDPRFVPAHVLTPLQAAPALALDELAIIRPGVPLPEGCFTTLLTDLFTALGPTTPLRALRIYCVHPLPIADLELIPFLPLPPRLQYIGWDATSTFTSASAIHVLERLDGKNGASDIGVVARTLKTIHRPWTEDWAAQGVLRYLGEEWTGE
ncbi:hypothetical protein C8R47DRAFT_742252 [Mycena vitilis]|nr:hypothetical protein C8R47DRAFT_742252 [Mycena vitilis]